MASESKKRKAAHDYVWNWWPLKLKTPKGGKGRAFFSSARRRVNNKIELEDE